MFYVDSCALRKKALDKGLVKINEISEKTGVNRNTLSDILSNNTQPSTSVINALISNLDIPQEDVGSIFFAKNLRDT